MSSHLTNAGPQNKKGNCRIASFFWRKFPLGRRKFLPQNLAPKFKNFACAASVWLFDQTLATKHWQVVPAFGAKCWQQSASVWHESASVWSESQTLAT